MPRIDPVPMEHLEPDLRQKLEAAVASGALGSSEYHQIIAYNMVTLRQKLNEPPPAQRGVLLEARLLELLRLRSAQLGGCVECAGVRYGNVISEDDAACMLAETNETLSEREAIGIRYMTLMHTDHHRIDDDLYGRLAQHFTTPEIVELGLYCALAVGTHRLLHTWGLGKPTQPVIRFDPSAVVRSEPAPV